MKFGQFMSYYTRKKFMNKFHKNCDLKISSRSFSVCKELSTTSTGKWNFWSKLLKFKISKTIKIWPNRHTGLLRLFFTEGSLKIKKGLDLFPGHFFQKNFGKNFSFVMLHKLAKFHHETVYFQSYSLKWVSCFMNRHFTTSWHLNIWKVIIWISQKRMFQKCSLLDIRNKLVKM